MSFEGMTVQELQAAVAAAQAEIASRVPEASVPEVSAPTRLVRLIARKRDLNARGRGSEEFRKIALPDGAGGWKRSTWVSDVGATVSNSWCSRGIRASERRCSTIVEAELPVGPTGAIVISFDKEVGGRGGSCSVHAGFLAADPVTNSAGVELPQWGKGIASVGQRGHGADTVVVVRLADGRTVEV